MTEIEIVAVAEVALFENGAPRGYGLIDRGEPGGGDGLLRRFGPLPCNERRGDLGDLEVEREEEEVVFYGRWQRRIRDALRDLPVRFAKSVLVA